MIFKNLFRRRSRSLLTMAGIAIGVAATIALGSLSAGLASGYQAIAGGSQADLVLAEAESYDLSLSHVDEHTGVELLAMPEVREVAGMMMGNVSAEEGAKYFFIFGHDPQGFAIDHFRVIEGQSFGARGVRGRPLLLGKNAAEGLEVGVDDTVNLTGGTFRVVGIYETGDAFEDGAAVITLKDAQTILQKPRLVNAFYLKIKDTGQAETREEDLAAADITVAQAEVQIASGELAQAQAQFDKIQNGSTAQEIAVLQAQVAQAQAALSQAEAALDKAVLRAPFAGTAGNVLFKTGEVVSPGAPVLVLGDVSSLRVETTDLNEVDAAQVGIGSSVTLTFDALPGITTQGEIVRIAPMASAGQGGTNFAAVIEMSDPPEVLRWGMTAFVDIDVD